MLSYNHKYDLDLLDGVEVWVMPIDDAGRYVPQDMGDAEPVNSIELHDGNTMTVVSNGLAYTPIIVSDETISKLEQYSSIDIEDGAKLLEIYIAYVDGRLELERMEVTLYPIWV